MLIQNGQGVSDTDHLNLMQMGMSGVSQQT